MHQRKMLIIRPATRLNADINVTPLVDVVLVMLIIFMVVTPLLERAMTVELPETRQVALPDSADQQIVVRLAATSQSAEVDGEPVTGRRYVDKLRKRLSGMPKGRRIVFFVADDGVESSRFVADLDGAREAVAETLGVADTNAVSVRRH
jgi:biopolymer transport protein ExbD